MDTLFKKSVSPFHQVVFFTPFFRAGLVHTVLERKKIGCPISLLGVSYEQFPCSHGPFSFPPLPQIPPGIEPSALSKGRIYRVLYPV